MTKKELTILFNRWLDSNNMDEQVCGRFAIKVVSDFLDTLPEDILSEDEILNSDIKKMELEELGQDIKRCPLCQVMYSKHGTCCGESNANKSMHDYANQAMEKYRNQPDYIQKRQEGVTKFITVAEMKDFEQKVSAGEWSYSFMVEQLCKMADSYRTQPQEGMEEVECTHPYKECVMSDRVNKYGTPLTKCSVCGNDNICDEELMDESVNTF